MNSRQHIYYRNGGVVITSGILGIEQVRIAVSSIISVVPRSASARNWIPGAMLITGIWLADASGSIRVSGCILACVGLVFLMRQTNPEATVADIFLPDSRAFAIAFPDNESCMSFCNILTQAMADAHAREHQFLRGSMVRATP